MKKKTTLFIILIMTLSAGTLLNCRKDPLDSFKIEINLNWATTTLNILVIDAATGQPISASNQLPHVRIKGSNANDVLDISGVKENTYKAAGGFLTLAVAQGVTPSINSAVSFTLEVKANGYLSAVVPVTFNKEGRSTLRVPMVSINQPPDGVSVIVQQINLVNGQTGEELVITSPEAVVTGTSIALTIPAKAVFKDKNGTRLNGTTNVQLALFSQESESALICLPGGLSVRTNVEGESGQFYSAGFLLCEISDQSGRIATVIENEPLNALASLSPQTYNPETNSTVKPGDTVPFWSYNEDNDIWHFESDAVVFESNGKLMVNSQLSHLSYWNWDWFDWCDECQYGSRHTIVSSVLPMGSPIAIYFQIHRQSDGMLLDDSRNHWGSGYIGAGGMQTFIGDMIEFWWVCPWAVVLEARSYWTDETVGAQIIENLCVGDYNLELTFPFLPETNSVMVEVSGTCPNDRNFIVYPSLGYIYKNVTTNSDWQTGYMENGKTTLYNMIPGHSYKFGMTFNGRYEEYELVIDQTGYYGYDLLFTQEMCDEIIP